MSRPPAIGLLLSLAIYLGLAATTLQEVGIVGEVAIAGWLKEPPTVELEPTDSGERRWGPLVARRTRPTESLEVGGFSLPLTVNAYTGGLSDWPVRLAVALFGQGAAVPTTVGLGALLIVLAHRFLRFHGSDAAPTAAALLLATDWAFLYYRKALGGTEVLLQASFLLVLWALWSRRWKGGRHGTVAIALGVGLGLQAKLTFVATVLAFGLSILLSRWDRQALRPPEPIRRIWLLLLPLLCVAPLLIAHIHHLFLDAPLLRSHDAAGLQLQRLWAGLSGGTQDRESLDNLLYFFGNPLAFFGAAYGAEAQPPLSILRLCSFAAVLGGVGLAWLRPQQSPADALLRFLSMFLPIQLGILLLLNRDMHHLGQMSVGLALLGALGADRLAGQFAPRGMVRRILAVFLLFPAMVAGVGQLWRSDGVLATIPVPTFTRSGQENLQHMLEKANVQRLYVADYESYGLLELLQPELPITQLWPAVAGGRRGPAILEQARGAHLLVLRASAPMIYNWNPSPRVLEKEARSIGIPVERVDSLRCGDQECAWLWKVGP
ncbi:MAG TPA: hypothetical protein PLA94_06370 [Myxococcota bacterium]|nr:hypothetical protein [Myxococcota bacterium]